MKLDYEIEKYNIEKKINGDEGSSIGNGQGGQG